MNNPTNPLEFADSLNWVALKFRAIRAAISGAHGDRSAMEGVEALTMDLDRELTALAKSYDGAEWGSQSGRSLTGREVVAAMENMPEPELRLVIEAVALLRARAGE